MLFKNKTYQLTTNLSEQEAFRILRYNTTEEQLMHFTKPNTFFTGKIENNYFKLKKVIEGQNNFVPILSGRISIKNNQTCIDFSFQQNSMVDIFIGLYIFVTSIFLIFASIMIVNDNLHPKAIILIPFPILFFGVLIYQVNTSDSKNESINFLEKLFQTKIHQIK
ncbi:hypothetical protein F0358_09600 [Empedobacter brevis]|uniref:hypothetical protein n=1 Tax=Empedobacter brevis TaxID=247 RepID=UPI00123D5872|nr:hypothetical protein [Empedobacter brevis]QES92951.1 hypothetical protein F0358_09600 [Empedobacter brevis]